MHYGWRRITGLRVSFTLLAAIAGWLPTAEAALISTKDEIEMAARPPSAGKQFGLVQDKELQDRIARIGARIAAVSDRKDITYTFKVLNSEEINALAVPGATSTSSKV
jgi:predicted Zn-dependent protease